MYRGARRDAFRERPAGALGRMDAGVYSYRRWVARDADDEAVVARRGAAYAYRTPYLCLSLSVAFGVAQEPSHKSHM
jgi:hypothetical protein